MIKLAMVYPSKVKENVSAEMLYCPLPLAYLARHTPDHYRMSLYDEYVGAISIPIPWTPTWSPSPP